MKTRLPALLFMLCICFSCIFSNCSRKNESAPPPPVLPPVDTTHPVVLPYQLVWSDEFNGSGLPDPAKWGYDVGGNGWGNNEQEYYTNAKVENARQENGNLVIEARKEAVGGNNYTSARLLTKNKAQWTYGRFEIRAKLPRGRGTWPAIWTLSDHNPLNWPADGELDIMEAVGFNPNVIYGTAHNKKYNGANGLQKGGNTTIPTAQDSFHVYKMEWSTTKIEWFVDDVSYFSYTDPGSGNDAWPYNSNFFIILNIAIGGNWGGQQGIDDTIFPQQMLIDYVRVYQRK